MSYELNDPPFSFSDELNPHFVNAKKAFNEGNLSLAIKHYQKILQHYEGQTNSWSEKTFIFYEFAQLMKWIGEDYESAIRLQQSAHALEMMSEGNKLSNTVIESAKRYVLAGDQLLKVSDQLSAAHCFLKAGLEFMSLNPRLSVDLSKFYGSIHGASVSSFFSAMCFEKSAELYEMMNRHADSTGDYFRASQITLKGKLYFDSYAYLKRAIISYVKRTGTIMDIAGSCPVLGKRTSNAENVLRVLRKRLYKSWLNFYRDNPHLGLQWVTDRTLKDLAIFYSTLSNELSSNGSQNESDIFYVKLMDSQRNLFWNEGKYLRWLFSAALNVVSQYGTNLVRWFIMVSSVIILFALLYHIVSCKLSLPIEEHPLILSAAAFVNISSISDVKNIFKALVILESGIGLIMVAVLIHLFFKKTHLRV